MVSVVLVAVQAVPWFSGDEVLKWGLGLYFAYRASRGGVEVVQGYRRKRNGNAAQCSGSPPGGNSNPGTCQFGPGADVIRRALEEGNRPLCNSLKEHLVVNKGLVEAVITLSKKLEKFLMREELMVEMGKYRRESGSG